MPSEGRREGLAGRLPATSNCSILLKRAWGFGSTSASRKQAGRVVGHCFPAPRIAASRGDGRRHLGKGSELPPRLQTPQSPRLQHPPEPTPRQNTQGTAPSSPRTESSLWRHCHIRRACPCRALFPREPKSKAGITSSLPHTQLWRPPGPAPQGTRQPGCVPRAASQSEVGFRSHQLRNSFQQLMCQPQKLQSQKNRRKCPSSPPAGSWACPTALFPGERSCNILPSLSGCATPSLFFSPCLSKLAHTFSVSGCSVRNQSRFRISSLPAPGQATTARVPPSSTTCSGSAARGLRAEPAMLSPDLLLVAALQNPLPSAR